MLKPRCQFQALQNPAAFRDALVEWFERNGKDYPWRRTNDPYAVLVSEVMLQQTRIATVLGKGFYTRFLQAFPDLPDLAAAEDQPLLKAWEGLGYYRRARMLRETARAVMDHHGGVFPRQPEELLRLPGIGRYTAGALRSFAFDLPAALVDGNVSRVLARLMDFAEPVDEPAGQKRIWEWAERLADPQRPGKFNAALMELGQTCCRVGVPDCLSCPVAAFCRSREPETLPVKRGKAMVTAVDEHALWVLDDRGRLLLHREAGKRRQGLWKLPTRQAQALEGLPLVSESHYTITRYRVRLRVYQGEQRFWQPLEEEAWIGLEEVPLLPMLSPFRRVVDRLLGERQNRV